jgi:hypothetical protein
MCYVPTFLVWLAYLDAFTRLCDAPIKHVFSVQLSVGSRSAQRVFIKFDIWECNERWSSFGFLLAFTNLTATFMITRIYVSSVIAREVLWASVVSLLLAYCIKHKLCGALGPFSTIVFVAPQIGARPGELLITVGFFPRSSASETEALQTLSVACPRYQERHKCDAPQLAIHCRLWYRFHERVQSRYSFEQSTSESEDICLYIMDHNLSFCDMLEQLFEGDDLRTEIV